jgi:ActR/RegA family two-component response regulator
LLDVLNPDRKFILVSDTSLYAHQIAESLARSTGADVLNAPFRETVLFFAEELQPLYIVLPPRTMDGATAEELAPQIEALSPDSEIVVCTNPVWPEGAMVRLLRDLDSPEYTVN